MLTYEETGRTGMCGPASEEIRGRINSDAIPTAHHRQASYIASRYVVSDAVARMVAHHAFSKGVLR